MGPPQVSSFAFFTLLLSFFCLFIFSPNKINSKRNQRQKQFASTFHDQTFQKFATWFNEPPLFFGPFLFWHWKQGKRKILTDHHIEEIDLILLTTNAPFYQNLNTGKLNVFFSLLEKKGRIERNGQNQRQYSTIKRMENWICSLSLPLLTGWVSDNQDSLCKSFASLRRWATSLSLHSNELGQFHFDRFFFWRKKQSKRKNKKDSKTKKNIYLESFDFSKSSGKD